MLLHLRMDWRGGEHGKKSARESGGLSWERPDIARDATDRTGLPKLAEPSGEPSERVTVAETREASPQTDESCIMLPT
jgi:hypothetical protein